MPPLFWTGKLTLPMKVLVNANNLLALLLPNANNPPAQLAGGETARYSGIDASFVKLNDHESRAERGEQ